MNTTKKIIISIDIETNCSMEKISSAIIKGLYYGLDVRRVASPQNVKINYFQER
jgi:hypothetical protein